MESVIEAQSGAGLTGGRGDDDVLVGLGWAGLGWAGTK